MILCAIFLNSFQKIGMLHNITIRYRHAIPHLDDIFDELSGAAVFSKI
jgi:hypothetical protein